jgi:hypothetical protein
VRREEKAATPAGGPANAHKTTAAINLPRAFRIHHFILGDSLQLGKLEEKKYSELPFFKRI